MINTDLNILIYDVKERIEDIDFAIALDEYNENPTRLDLMQTTTRERNFLEKTLIKLITLQKEESK